MARKIVSHALGVPVEFHDDGCHPAMVDALIRYPDGSVGAMEVVADHDREYKQFWAALEKSGHSLTVSELDHAWNVVLRHSASVSRVAERLPALLQGLEAGGYTDLRQAQRSARSQLVSLASEIGVRMAFVVERDSAGTVHLRADGWTGVAQVGPALGAWVPRVLAKGRNETKAHKLRNHAGASERHIFIWATMGSPFDVQRCLEPDEPAFGLDASPPSLPAGITHLWIAGYMATQSAVAWSADRGWWRTGWAFPNRMDTPTE